MKVTMDTRMNMFKYYLDKTNMSHKQYQYEGVRWCINNEIRENPIHNVRGGFLADEMGLGKTIMMIGIMYCNFVNRTLIIVPPILVDQWFLQIYKTTGHKPLIYHGNNKKTLTFNELSSAKIIISTYGAITLNKKQIKNGIISELHKITWNRIIFDEAHHLRNSKATRHISARLLNADIRWLVSGTPIQNKKKDFYSLCSVIGLPASFYTETSNLDVLVKTFILKRTKKQVGIEMTPVNIQQSIVDWTSRQEMELSEVLHAALSFSKVDISKRVNNHHIHALIDNPKIAIMLRARQSCIYPKLMSKGYEIPSYYTDALNHSSKLDAVIHTILQRKNNGCGKLIFCTFHDEMDEIARRLRDGGINTIATFDGRITQSKRNKIIAQKNEVLILQIQTGCEGLNLQDNYSEIYFISPHWNPTIEDQAIARCHRIGQNKPVYVHKFEMSSFVSEIPDITTKNIEKYVNDIQQNKRNIASYFIG
jgi:SNF2 family DNA or RNA helicase